ncbi:hypothetical protein Rsub_03378 [Raphidocelis subcapitata]|uniref:Cleft lip and palate transmembrane 1 n=1 Tax=Raphidocelis subcapitata TaxID=307507 RepID=A0A2V0NZK6_9CHLO|nr:hypothetical protein Rsub_03378 [Raphidocelis subcapitata]|eukprot:GBF90245.1 hypothetical protein Rsub_03378 [Raphidocelis subcapitata]
MPPRGAVAAAGPPGGPAEGQQQPQAAGGSFLSGLLRMAVMWYLFNMFKPGGQTKTAGGAGAVGTVRPLYVRGELLDLRVFLSEAPRLESFKDGQLIWQQNNVPLGTAPESKFTYTYTPSEAVKNNGSVYLHAVFSIAGSNPEAREELPPGAVFTKTLSLIRYMPRPKNKTGVNLLSAEGGPVTTPKTVTAAEPSKWVSFWKPNATIAVADHFNAYQQGAVPPQMRDMFAYADGSGERYLPIAYFDEFWLLRDRLLPVNDTVTELPLHLVLKTASIWWMQLQQQMDQSFSMQVNMGVAGDGESDEVKRIFLEGNPVLLAITMVVSLFHSVFDFMAFKNDVAFWKDNRSMEGLSARSVMVNAFCQAVIFFYLLDNETSTVVLISSGVGTAIEFWKVTKAFDVSTTRTFPFISVRDKASYTDARHNTNMHDKDAMRYLSYALYPCVIGYSLYTLKYETHRSWYSWVLGSLVGAVYTFGFILMCPQLYLNYKLKSVAHLPWRQMTYKFLNTIIDDLFAFVIKMPTLHRLSVFRDDIIFMIFLYQRWIYRVDKSRVNEFGFSGEMAEEREKRQLLEADGTAGGGEGGAAATAGAAGAIEGPPAEGARRRKAAAAAGSSEEQADGKPSEAAAEAPDSRKDK